MRMLFWRLTCAMFSSSNMHRPVQRDWKNITEVFRKGATVGQYEEAGMLLRLCSLSAVAVAVGWNPVHRTVCARLSVLQ